MEFDYSKLKGRIVEKFGTVGHFCEAYGISEVIMSKKLNNKSNFTTDNVVNMSNLLGINIDEIGMFFYAKKV